MLHRWMEITTGASLVERYLHQGFTGGPPLKLYFQFLPVVNRWTTIKILKQIMVVHRLRYRCSTGAPADDSHQCFTIGMCFHRCSTGGPPSNLYLYFQVLMMVHRLTTGAPPVDHRQNFAAGPPVHRGGALVEHTVCRWSTGDIFHLRGEAPVLYRCPHRWNSTAVHRYCRQNKTSDIGRPVG